jgi:hypothetical protein
MRRSSGLKASCFSFIGILRSPFRRRNVNAQDSSAEKKFQVAADLGHATYAPADEDETERFVVLSPAGGVESPNHFDAEEDFGPGAFVVLRLNCSIETT